MIEISHWINNFIFGYITHSKSYSINKIQKHWYIVGHEDLINSNVIVNTSYNLNNRYSLADIIYQKNQETFDSYDYLLIDYPPTIQELALNFLLISDLIVVPINSGSGSYKGIVDLQNTLNYICQQEKREILCLNLYWII
ncbi:CobQ/CobB/MinD/ParA nucleotide binding domain protein [Spiroplasma poulsonii]|uniref:AAA family ATPase n=1 Tax=Spiroplasma poulsonii TaxID=2138 RepID=UPI000D670B65|nr:AAA family ATPase [Spiroplasma poulsonii]PWF94173.1 CobQ/CobB/MinD/ParA nucleotide binding domain protein [Spiroplasma poulsonii]